MNREMMNRILYAAAVTALLAVLLTDAVFHRDWCRAAYVVAGFLFGAAFIACLAETAPSQVRFARLRSGAR